MLKGSQLRMARAASRLSVRELAQIAEVAPNTVTRIEGGLPANTATLRAIQRALEGAGIEFIDENGCGPGVRLRKAL